MLRGLKKNYHWVIAGLACLDMILYGGILNTWGVFIIPVCDSFSAERSVYALVDMLYSASSMLSTMVSGLLFGKLGYKKSAVGGLILVVLGLVLMSCSGSLLGFGLSKMLLGIGYGTTFMTGVAKLVRTWFVKHQGMLIGIISMCTGLGGSLMTLLGSAMVEAWGWRITVAVYAALMAGITLLSLLLLKNSPADIGLKPLGEGLALSHKPKKKERPLRAGLSFGQLAKKPLFYLVALVTFLTGLSMYAAISVLIPHFQTLGFSPSQAALFQSVFMLSLAGVKLLCGSVCDRIGPKAVILFCVGAAMVSEVLLGFTANSVLSYVGVILLSFGSCMNTIMIPLMVMELFGYRASDMFNGILLGLISLSSVAASFAGNRIFDSVGSYSPGIRLGALLNGVLILLYCIVFVWAKKQQKNEDNMIEDNVILGEKQ